MSYCKSLNSSYVLGLTACSILFLMCCARSAISFGSGSSTTVFSFLSFRTCRARFFTSVDQLYLNISMKRLVSFRVFSPNLIKITQAWWCCWWWFMCCKSDSYGGVVYNTTSQRSRNWDIFERFIMHFIEN